jgi:hypothetical protein
MGSYWECNKGGNSCLCIRFESCRNMSIIL